MASVKPIVGHWYDDVDEGQTFKVVAVDADTETVIIQYFNGNIEKLDMDTWQQIDLTEIEPPENWSGVVDDIELDDFGDTDLSVRLGDWSPPQGDLDNSEE